MSEEDYLQSEEEVDLALKKAGKKVTFVEYRREQPLEEKHNFFQNLFLCFIVPFVCRCEPVTDRDMPATMQKDRSYNVMRSLSPRWRQTFLKYQNEVEENRIMGRRYTEADKEAEKVPEPSLTLVLAQEVVLPEDVFSWIMILASVAVRCLQTVFTKNFIGKVGMKGALEGFIAALEIEGKNRDSKTGLPIVADAPIDLPADVLIPGLQEAIPSFPYGWGIMLMISPVLINMLDSLGYRYIYHFSGRLRAGLAGLIYEKTMQLNISAQSMIDTGRLLTLISADSRQVAEQFGNTFALISVPFYVFVGFIILIIEFGWPVIVLVLTQIGLLCIQTVVLFFQVKHYRHYLRWNDKRNKIVNETIQGIRVVKYTGLENVFVAKINVPRARQNAESSWAQFWMQFGTSFMRCTIPVGIIVTIVLVTWDNDYDAVGIAMNVLPFIPFVVLFTQYSSLLPPYFQNFFLMVASFNRIRQFLLLPELVVEERAEPDQRDMDLVVENVTCQWGEPPAVPLSLTEQEDVKRKLQQRKKEDARKERERRDRAAMESSSSSSSSSVSVSTNAAPQSQEEKIPELRDISFALKHGSLTMIIGAIGSGKSSIGGMIIGDMERLSGTIKSRGTIAYCSQNPWINNDSVRGNITFGKIFDEEKYLNTIRVCALEPDLKMLAAGDKTVIGEKGVNLSGGQKARIQLARSIYSDRDVYVLDDPLSAVDAHVGRFIFEKCICEQLRGKTRLLMTNHLQYLPLADQIIVVECGTIKARGTYQELRDQGINFDEYIIKKEGDQNPEQQQPDETNKPQGTGANQETGATLADLEGQHNEQALHLMTEEEQSTGMVPIAVYGDYINTLNAWYWFIPWLIFVIVPEGAQAMSDYWIGVIGSPTQYTSVFSQPWKFGFDGFLILMVMLFAVFRACLVKYNVDRSNSILHEDLLQSVIHCPPSFFDTTPMGRILNRFTGDIPQTDLVLHNLVIQVYAHLLSLIATVIIVAVDNTFFLYIGLPLLLVFAIYLAIYSRAARNIQRLESISRSPVISHYSQTVSGAGLSTIRAYHIEDQWKRRFNYLNDEWTTRFVLFRLAQKWSSLICGFLTTIFLVPVVVIGWNKMDANKLIVAINSSSNFSIFAGLVVTNGVELDARMTSFERIRFYTNKLPQETRKVSEKPPASWPAEGAVEYEHVTMKYRPNLPYVLKDVSFAIQPHEKIGVCGRTGAGKSSLLFTLFRLVELDPELEPDLIDINTGFPIKNEDPEKNSGRILIDGVDISKIPLSRLRRSIAIIPQDPTLFTGTIRKNLNLANRCTDDQIWEALELVEMKKIIMALPFGLDTQLSEGGNNFSSGQKQLLCFARAILNNCKVVVLDEATASVDVETDAKIQETIRRVFKEQTVIVIAHRLNTIMNSDRIMVMADGKVVEFDTPANLQANENSEFNSLLRSTSA